ncbi:MAG: glycerate kinase [Verrucomicrobiales bacterium]|nr:glycerate kinase [Verrucomicrobiales bacterium]
MRILISPDKFKGSMTASEVAGGLADFFQEQGHETAVLPIADGGEGTARVLCDALGGSMESATVSDPLGRPVEAEFAVAGKVAILEMSQASGLWRLTRDELDPWKASTFGTGELIRSAAERFSVEKIVIGIGGSATNDGGTGMAQALGIRFPGADSIPADLTSATGIDFTHAEEFPEIEVACDVENPLLGENGASRVYGPQKGIREGDFEQHEDRLCHLVQMLGSAGQKLADQPGSGAAGGLGFGLMAFCGAQLKPGFDLVADLLELEIAVANCDLVITGEGNLDRQTLQGKGPHGVARMARRLGKRIIAVVGGTDQSDEVAREFDAVVSVPPHGMPVEEAMQRGPALLREDEFRQALTGQIAELGA